MTTLNQAIYFRKYGVRTLSLLMTPILHDLKDLSLPLRSLYHHVTYDGIALGPEPDEFIFNGQTKSIFLHNVNEVGDELGPPRKLVISEGTLLRELLNKNRRLRQLRALESTAKDQQTLICYNYCLIAKNYRYVRAVFTEYYKWHNTFAAITREMANVASLVESNQYLLCGIPKILPSIAQLDAASKNISQPLLKIFNDVNSWMVLELWKWLGPDRETSLFSKIPRNKLHLINLVHQETGKWTLINLGYLDAFRLNALDENKENTPENTAQVVLPGAVGAEQVQKRFLRFLMRVMEARTATANTSDAQDAKGVAGVLQNKSDMETDAMDNGEFDFPAVDEDSNSILGKKQLNTAFDVQLKSVEELDKEEEDETPEQKKARMVEEERILDEELAALNEIAHKSDLEVESSGVDFRTIMAVKDAPLEKGVLDVCERLADDGLLTAGEYKRFTALAGAYKNIKNPYGEGTLGEQIQVSPEQLILKKTQSFLDEKTVVDKTMLSSTLVGFDKQYIKEILPRHTASMVTQIQKAGVAVADYQIELTEDIMGSYEDHTVKLIPVEGAPSTIKFKIPKIQEDGTFEASGTKYRMRKQRGD
jgi:hypothetical protein